MLNVNKETIVDEVKTIISDRAKVEANLNISSEKQDKIVSVSGFVAATDVKIENGVITNVGKVFFNIIIAGEEPERVETGIRFEFKKTAPEGAAHVCCEYFLEDFAVKNEGGMSIATCDLGYTLSVYSERLTSYVADADCLVDKKDFSSLVSSFSLGSMETEDSFETVKVKKPLLSEARAVVTSTENEKNTVTVGGYAVISFVLLPFSENSDIVKEVRTIPFRFEFDLEGATTDSVSVATVSVNELAVKIVTDEEDNKSTVESTLRLDFCIASHKTVSLTQVSDCAYSECFTDTVKTEYSFLKPVKQKSVNERITGKAVVDIPEYSRFIKAVGERAYVDEVKYVDGEAQICGIIESDCVFYGDNGLISKKAELPYVVAIDCEEGLISNVSVCVENLQGKLRSGKLEQDVTLFLSYVENENVTETITTDISEGAEKTSVKAPISIYIGRKGDTEWDVMKALTETAETIYEYNEGLTFPLNGDERIIVFKKP